MAYVIPDRVLELARKGWWIGVDVDGTTFTFAGDKWVKWNVFGDPIVPMIERIRTWVNAEVPVRAVTARINVPVGTYGGDYLYSHKPDNVCVVTGEHYSDAMMAKAIKDKFESIGLPRFPVQPHKGGKMIELWDDRAVQVVVNTGRTLAEEHEAELSALRGAAFQGGPMVVEGAETFRTTHQGPPPHIEELPRGEYISPGEAMLRRTPR